MSERSTEVTRTINDVRIVPVPRVLVPVSEIHNLQSMRFISYIVTTIGGVIAGIGYPTVYFWLGFSIVVVGLILEYVCVQRAMGRWGKCESREINYNDTEIETTEFK